MRSKRGYSSGGFTSRSRNRKKSDFSLDFALKNMYNYSSRRRGRVGVKGRTDDISPVEMTVGCNDTGTEFNK